VKLDKINKTYETGPTRVKALIDISLEINEGDFLAVMGPSGSGKSTLLNIIGTLDKPVSGEYFFQEQPVSDKGSRALARIRRDCIGFTFQEFHLLARYSALGNVAMPLTYKGFGGKKKQKIALDALKRVNLAARKKHKPSQLSGGEQQRVAIARALVNQPKILLADEPTGNLDSRTGKMIMELLKKLNEEGLTVILVTHDINMARYASKILQLSDGKLTGFGGTANV
jgi:putative ABC transport system ATP-binding protein